MWLLVTIYNNQILKNKFFFVIQNFKCPKIEKSDEPTFTHHPRFNNFQLVTNLVLFLPLSTTPTHWLHFEANPGLSMISSVNILVSLKIKTQYYYTIDS